MSSYEFPYQRTFDAIAAATSHMGERSISVSVKKFQEAFNSHRDAEAQPIHSVAQEARPEVQDSPTGCVFAISTFRSFSTVNANHSTKDATTSVGNVFQPMTPPRASHEYPKA